MYKTIKVASNECITCFSKLSYKNLTQSKKEGYFVLLKYKPQQDINKQHNIFNFNLTIGFMDKGSKYGIPVGNGEYKPSKEYMFTKEIAFKGKGDYDFEGQSLFVQPLKAPYYSMSLNGLAKCLNEANIILYHDILKWLRTSKYPLTKNSHKTMESNHEWAVDYVTHTNPDPSDVKYLKVPHETKQQLTKDLINFEDMYTLSSRLKERYDKPYNDLKC